MLLPHNKVSGGVQDSQIMIPSFFDRFYVMPPLTNGVHYNIIHPKKERCKYERGISFSFFMIFEKKRFFSPLFRKNFPFIYYLQ